MALILVNRSFRASLREAFLRKNIARGYVVVIVASVTALVLLLPRAQELLGFGLISWRDMLLALGLGLGLLLILEAGKFVLTARVRAQRG